MIRRLLILGIGTSFVAAAGALSYVRQFGYISSWFSVGIRKGTLTYVWRATPISDALGLVVDDPSAVNRTMYSIGAGTRWRQVSFWAWMLCVLMVVLYLLVLPRIRRLWIRSPRWLIGGLIAVCIAFAALWATSHMTMISYTDAHVRFFLSGGYATISVERLQTMYFPSATGWRQYRVPIFDIGSGGTYLRFQNGGLAMNLPLGMLLIMLVVTTIVVARPNRRAGPGFCRQCAYDLTGNVSGVCPECGTAT